MPVSQSATEKLLKQLNLSEDELIGLQQGVLNTDANVISSAIKSALQEFAKKNPSLNNQKTVETALTLLNNLSEISPYMRKQMQSQGLYKANPHTVLHDPKKLAELRLLFNNATQNNTLDQLDIDIERAMELALETAKEKRKAHAQLLNDSLRKSRQYKEALDDTAATTEKAVFSKRDNALFGSLRVIGHLVFLLLLLDFLVPVDEQNNALGFDYVEPANDEYRDLYKKVYADLDVLPSEGQLAAKELPPWLKAK